MSLFRFKRLQKNLKKKPHGEKAAKSFWNVFKIQCKQQQIYTTEMKYDNYQDHYWQIDWVCIIKYIYKKKRLTTVASKLFFYFNMLPRIDNMMVVATMTIEINSQANEQKAKTATKYIRNEV